MKVPCRKCDKPFERVGKYETLCEACWNLVVGKGHHKPIRMPYCDICGSQLIRGDYNVKIFRHLKSTNTYAQDMQKNFFNFHIECFNNKYPDLKIE